jgi:prepilin-type N-terminal cleavage/methylation domain-containing protein
VTRLRSLRRDDGFGLTELIIAMSILLVGILAVTGMLASGILHIRNASQTTTAGALASTEMERLRAIHWSAIGLDETDVATADTSYSGDEHFEPNAADRVALPSCATSPAPCTGMLPVKTGVPGADGRTYRVDTFVNWRATDGRRVKEATIVVRDGADDSRVWASISSSFDGRDPTDVDGAGDGPEDNVAPVLTPIGNQYTAVNSPVSILLDAFDENGDDLSYLVSGLPPGTSFNNSFEEISGSPEQDGTYDVSVTVSDGELSSSAGFRWVVLDGSAFPINLGLGKAASQSSTRSGDYGASNALDGNTSTSSWSGSVASTNTQSQPWWQVDLGEFVSIGQIKVYPSGTLSDFYVISSPTPFTSNDLTASLNQNGVRWFHISSGIRGSATINFNESGRYVRVQRATSNGRLQLAEVQIFNR